MRRLEKIMVSVRKGARRTRKGGRRWLVPGDWFKNIKDRIPTMYNGWLKQGKAERWRARKVYTEDQMCCSSHRQLSR
jgi:hypothetical protein